jgi:hypothetical protein
MLHRRAQFARKQEFLRVRNLLSADVMPQRGLQILREWYDCESLWNCMQPLIKALLISFLFAEIGSANLMTNGSFEYGNTAMGIDRVLPPRSTAIEGWTVVGVCSPCSEILWDASGEAPGRLIAENGDRFLFLPSFNLNAGVTQTVNLPAGRYILTFYVSTGGGDESTLGVTVGSESPVIVETTTISWAKEHLDFSIDGGPTQITFNGEDVGGIDLDNVDLEPASSPATEPSTACFAVPVLGTLILLKISLTRVGR